MASNYDQTDAQPHEDVSRTRRHLLKAAASAAPLIATLPSGAARAQASAFNCVIQEQEEADFGRPTQDVALDQADQYIRVTATKTLYLVVSGQNTGVLDVYEFSVNGSPIAVDVNGNYVDLTNAIEQDDPLDRKLLILYATTGGMPPTGADDNCKIKSGLQYWPTYPTEPNLCVFPIAELNDVTDEGGVNIGMPLSCWCSLNPNDGMCTPP